MGVPLAGTGRQSRGTQRKRQGDGDNEHLSGTPFGQVRESQSSGSTAFEDDGGAIRLGMRAGAEALSEQIAEHIILGPLNPK